MFSGYPAPRIAAELTAQIDRPPSGMQDPLAVLQWVGRHRSAVELRKIEDALIAAEVVAAASAAPTPYAREVLEMAKRDRVPVAVVSNNSATAIEVYLAKHRLDGYVEVIVGRPYAEPSRMKPDPFPLRAALQRLGAEPTAGTMVGDSVTDIEAARAAGVRVVGYANRPGKTLATADVVISSMAELLVE
ncbi:HAD family hydrolase [Actinoplanes sp. LDG1-06]|uniref:HAD family hydrolase n=2 Tax=Paractinoplanes ovalisporus TaxID=2810368 RepID=A0ABS2ABZ7_9ACTN|nr:HAD family hydrolase [Actinoplanes ovalisporus]